MRKIKDNETIRHYQRYVNEFKELDKLSKEDIIERYFYRLNRNDKVFAFFVFWAILATEILIIFGIKYYFLIKLIGG